MGIRKALLAASIGTIMIGDSDAKSYNDSTYSQKAHQFQSISKDEIQEMNFKKNYHYLCNNVDGAWFSFGDEDKLRQALYEIGSFPMGRKVIAGIPENMEFGSTNFMASGAGGGFDILKNELEMNTSFVNGDFFDNNGVQIKIKDSVFHELLHAYQKNQGLMLVNDYPSVDELLHVSKLVEAEAAAWNKALELTSKISSSNSYFLRPKEVDTFMKRDLVAEARKEYKKYNFPFNEKKFKKNNERYLFQQTLIECRGHYDLAQKKTVGKIIRQLMNNGDSGWEHSYNEQALQITMTLCKDKKVSREGNPEAYQRVLRYYAQMYGLKPQDISNNQLQTKHKNLVVMIKNKAKDEGLYTTVKYSDMSKFAQRRKNSR